jgi:uncharacterized membrane protein
VSALARALVGFAAGGFAGYIAETLYTGEARYSHFFDDRKIPFLPIYGVGAAAIAAAAPALHEADAPWWLRFVFYSAGLTVVEMAGCAIDRSAGDASWNYDNSKALATAAGGCVSLPHSLLWGALGLAVDQLVML